MDNEHARFMQVALEEAALANAEGSIGVGSAVVHEGRVIERGHNTVDSTFDLTAHAETATLRSLSIRLRRPIPRHGTGPGLLAGHVLYTTVEPCAMCCGAVLHARLARVVYGAPDPKAGAARSLYRLLDDPRMNHEVAVTGGVRSVDCAGLVVEFFRSKRS